MGLDIGLGCDRWAGNRESTYVRTKYQDIDKYGQHIIRNNTFKNCSQSGICGAFSWKTQIIGNNVQRTDYRNEYQSMETAAIKVHYMNDGLIQGSYIKDTGFGNGIWVDWGNQGLRITQNVLVNNPEGFLAECLSGPILVDNNVFINNGRVKQMDAAGIIYANNYFFNETFSLQEISVGPEGRGSYIFEPHTMNSKNYNVSPGNTFVLNNIITGASAPTLTAPGSLVQGNASNAGSNFTYEATDTGVSISFTMDAAPFGDHVGVYAVAHRHSQARGRKHK